MKQITNDIPKIPHSAKAVAPAKALNDRGKVATLVVTKAESCPFRDLIDEWLEYCRMDLSAKSITDYRAKVYKFWWWWDKFHAANIGMHPVNVTTIEARAFAVYLKTPNAFRWGEETVRDKFELAPASIASYGRAVKVFFSWLEAEGYIAKSPFNKSVKFTNRHKQDQIIKVVEAEDLVKIFRALSQDEYKATYHGARNFAIVALLLDSGMRRGELLNLKLSDVNLEKGQCRIPGGKTGARWAFFNEVCQDALANYLHQHRYPQEQKKSPIPAQLSTCPLWLTEDGAPLAYESVTNIVQYVERISGVKFHLHQLRHTFASFMVNRTDIYSVQKLLGHASVKTTEVYMHNSRDNIEAKYRPNSPLDALAGQESGLKRRRGRPRRK